MGVWSIHADVDFARLGLSGAGVCVERRLGREVHGGRAGPGGVVLFCLVFDLALLALLVISEGQFSPTLLPWLLLFNPADVYRLINLSGFDTGPASVGVMALAGDLAVPTAVLWLCLALWVVGPLAWAYWLFGRRAA